MSSTTLPTPAGDIPPPLPRQRIRDLFPKIRIGRHPTGSKNSITDVPEVLVSTHTIHQPNGENQLAINTGITAILPRADWFKLGSTCGIFRFNGSGEMTGSHWLEETGLLNSPIVITNSFSVGACYTGIYDWAIREHANEDGEADWFLLPVVAETFDGFMNDIGSMAVTADMVVKALDAANKDCVKEGCEGGGTGMMTQGFKSGTGSSSRIVYGKTRIEGEKEVDSEWVVGALVQANYGAKYDLKIGNVPVGRLLMTEEELAKAEKNLYRTDGSEKAGESVGDDAAKKSPPKDGSIIIILATDAPLTSLQLSRLAKRATVGLARVGGWGSNSSGDIFLAFSTASGIPRARADRDGPFDTVVNQMLPNLQDETINPLFEAAADAVEESIYNALCMAHDTIGPKGREAKAIDLRVLRDLLEKHHI